ncbi:hypothetical protein [Luteimonas huabeiensis]|uniref:hypothetical protein n=1 Tax=Luteimonas huabeiensis TaxID=1244513 RepID=UPI0009DD55FE|nr:hypothetical protein [Luteimonas huabeiensis]
MNKTQAEAITQAILEPDVRAQEDIQRRRAAEALSVARRRQVALLMLIGCAIGGVTAHFLGVRFTLGIIWGGIAGSAFGWFVVWLRSRPRAT